MKLFVRGAVNDLFAPIRSQQKDISNGFKKVDGKMDMVMDQTRQTKVAKSTVSITPARNKMNLQQLIKVMQVVNMFLF